MGEPARLALAFVGIIAVAGCGGGADAPDASVGEVGTVPEYEQRDGDAAAGWRALIEEGYVGCGVPLEAYAQVQGPAPLSMRLPDRAGTPNETMPYNLTVFTTARGVDVVAPNCLQCHAETLLGERVIGLGSHTVDYTDDLSTYADLACALVDDPTAQEECQKWRDRVVAVAPYTDTDVIGVNPADNLAAVLFAHRDNETLAWSDEPLLPLPPEVVVPVDVPPWWRMQRKHAMFYVGAGRGDHARIMMTASTLCVDTVDEAREIDTYFPDVRAFLMSLVPPEWPFAIDAELAAAGQEVFDATCARCHGTYGEGGEYPNMIVSLDEVGTDSTLALGAAQFAGEFVSWFNNSFYGEIAHLAPAQGYVAPPLDGIWATAPFLHNGSVPTLAALLDSSQRPRYFRRSFNTSDYSETTVGWNYLELPGGQDTVDREIKLEVYDTDLLGYGNGGHTFGDELDPEDRAAVLEYLKTL